MPYLCDIRVGSANNVIQVNNKLFIENVEFTPTNLAPIAFSAGPVTSGGTAGTTNGTTPWAPQSLSQLCLPRVYARGSMGVYPQIGNGGQWDTTRIACGQDIAGTGFIYSTTQARYYGVSGYGVTGYLGGFDANFRQTGYLAGYTFAGANSFPFGWLFLSAQNDRWFTLQEAGGMTLATNGLLSTIATAWGTLTEAGTYTSIGAISRYASMPYIGSDWVFIVGTPFYPNSNTNTESSVPAYICARNTGTMTTLNSNWISTVTTDYTSIALCFPSNAIVETPGSSFYFYQPVMSNTAGSFYLYIGTVSNLASTPTISSSVTTAATVTSPGGVDTTTDILTTSADVPNFSRVLVSTSGTLPAPLAPNTFYWTIRLTATTSRIATSYANAVAGTYIDLTTTGTGTQTLTRHEMLNLDTSMVTIPSTPTSSVWRNVRAWTFSDSGTNYLCVGVYEVGASVTVPTNAINLYLWRLDSKTSATFLQKLTTGDAGRVRSYLTLDSTQKRLAIVYDDKIMFYAWNSSTNWTFQSTQIQQTQDVGVDAQGRVWATGVGSYAYNVPTGYTSQSLYVYEPAGAAANITVTFQQSAYSYTGATIASNVIVNAYDVTGARVALPVTLTRDTENFSFSGGAASTAVTTSTSADTLVPISVFGTGLLSVLAVPT
jgi:hypothetical protein